MVFAPFAQFLTKLLAESTRKVTGENSRRLSAIREETNFGSFGKSRREHGENVSRNTINVRARYIHTDERQMDREDA